jgi:hypothetical protein
MSKIGASSSGAIIPRGDAECDDQSLATRLVAVSLPRAEFPLAEREVYILAAAFGVARGWAIIGDSLIPRISFPWLRVERSRGEIQAQRAAL